MKIRNKYYINNIEVDVSTYSIQIAKGIPGEYRIKTEYDDTEKALITALDKVDDKIQGLECRINSDLGYKFDKLQNRFRKLIELIETEIPEEVRYKLNDLKYDY